MSNVDIRIADESELGEIAEVVSRAFQTSPVFAGPDSARYDKGPVLASMGRGTVLVASVDGKVAGAVTLFPPDPESDCDAFRTAPSLSLLGVQPQFGGHGVAGGLIEALEDSARAQGHTSVAASVTQRSPRLVELYKRHGYRTVSQFHWPTAIDPSFILVKDL